MRAGAKLSGFGQAQWPGAKTKKSSTDTLLLPTIGGHTMASFITREAQSITAGNSTYSSAAQTTSSYSGPEYPPEWDLPEAPEPETELSFCHCDMVEDESCGGNFHERTIRIPDSDRTFTCYCCDECRELRTIEELVELAIEAYGEDWKRHCTVEIPVDNEPYYI